MSANSKPKTSKIKYWLKGAAEEFAGAGIPSALLDAEIILAHTLRRSRTWLHAHDDDELEPRIEDIANARARLRLDHTPIAYIIGHKEFYGRLFKVTPSVLIPRPESEEIIALLKTHLPKGAKTLVDIGTGSGCLGITAKLELPRLSVTLADISRHALTVAKQNATDLHADVAVSKSDLLSSFFSLHASFDIIIANLPYVDKLWDRSPETDSEPALALFADNGGLALVYRLIQQVPFSITSGGILLLEADPEQHSAIIDYAAKHGLAHIETNDYALAFRAN